jgi:hypothetical protein
MPRIRFSESRRQETILALDMCASSRCSPEVRREIHGYDCATWYDSVSTQELGWLTDLSWRTIELAANAWYATFYGGCHEYESEEIAAEAAQRLREGRVLVLNSEGMPEWKD